MHLCVHDDDEVAQANPPAQISILGTRLSALSFSNKSPTRPSFLSLLLLHLFPASLTSFWYLSTASTIPTHTFFSFFFDFARFAIAIHTQNPSLFSKAQQHFSELFLGFVAHTNSIHSFTSFFFFFTSRILRISFSFDTHFNTPLLRCLKLISEQGGLS